MTKREQQILHIIEINPLISQNDLAKKLGITRSSIAVHLSNLMKKGYIKGKGYIINKEPYICVIGGANIDIVGFSNQKLIYKDTNLGKLQLSLGGVGRNIAENLVHLGIRVRLISVIGDDIYGKQIIDNCHEQEIDIRDCLFVKNTPSSVLIAIMDKNNDMALGLSAMDIYEKLDVNFFQKKKEQIKKSFLTVIDTNILSESIEYITSNINSTYFVDTVSGSKANRAKNILDKIQYLKTNIIEAGILWGQKITNQIDLVSASQYFHKKGILKVFITMGENGVFYSDEKEYDSALASKVKLVSTNGAGDAFCSGAIYGIYNDLSTLECVEIGMKCAELTITHPLNVNPEINEQMIG